MSEYTGLPPGTDGASGKCVGVKIGETAARFIRIQGEWIYSQRRYKAVRIWIDCVEKKDGLKIKTEDDIEIASNDNLNP